MKKFYLLILSMIFLQISYAQMYMDGDTLYGNEWIKYEKEYYTFPISEDGIYRISFQTLRDAGIPTDQIPENQYRLFSNGKEVPVYISPGNFIEFPGYRNRGEMDAHFYKDPEREQFNPEYSLYTDKSMYYLAWFEEGTPAKRLVDQNIDINNLPPETPSLLKKETLVNSANYVKRYLIQGGVFYSHYERGEGFGLGFTKWRTVFIESKDISFDDANAQATLELTLASNQEQNHQLNILFNGELLYDTTFSNWQMLEYSFNIPLNKLQSTNKVEIIGQGNSSDRYGVSVVNLTYPQKSNDILSGGFAETLIPAGDHLFSNENQIPVIVIEQDKNKRYSTAGVLRFNSESESTFIIDNIDNVKEIENLVKYKFVNNFDANNSYLILSHNSLFDDGNGNNWVQEYADYRSSSEGGNHSVYIADMEEIYHEFGYGLEYHAMAVRNYIHYFKKNAENFEYLFIVGKGREAWNTRSGFGDYESLVPTIGRKGSDVLLAADQFDSHPIVSLGRLPAISGEEVKIYLDKMKEFEFNQQNAPQTIEDRAWMKKLIHLSGGGVPSEQATIRGYLDRMAEEIEANGFGGEVTTFQKTSTDVIEVSQSQDLLDRIAEGVAMVTFLGHSSASTFDFAINSPDDFNNKGRYMCFNALGCSTGQVHNNFRSLSEKFVFTPDEGAIAFVASSGLSFLNPLNTYEFQTYVKMGIEKTQGFGKVMNIVLHDLIDINASIYILMAEQLILNGDPAFTITPFEGPDFVFEENSATTEPSIVFSDQDSFSLKVNLYNLGATVEDSLQISIYTGKDGFESSRFLFKKTVTPPSHLEEIEIKLDLSEFEPGKQKVFLVLNEDNSILEYPSVESRSNNSYYQGANEGYELFIFKDEITTIYPSNFGIVNTDIRLIASNSNPKAKDQPYFIQIDTSELFDSPMLNKEIVNSEHGYLDWIPPIQGQDEMVYYWRISPDTVPGSPAIWTNSSFVYLPNSQYTGWNQSHYYQFLKNKEEGIKTTTNGFEFYDRIFDVHITNGIMRNGFVPGIYLNSKPNIALSWDGGTRNGFVFLILDGESKIPVEWKPGSITYRNGADNISRRANLLNVLENVKEGDLVIMMSSQIDESGYKPEEWALDSASIGKNLFQFFESQGAKQIRGLETSGAKPFVFIFKKDVKSWQPIEIYGNSDQEINYNNQFTGKLSYGAIKSSDIGPSKYWIESQFEIILDSELEEFSIDILDIKDGRIENILIQDSEEMTDLSQIGSEIEKIKFSYYSNDSIRRTPGQLAKWRVFYEEPPEFIFGDILKLPKDSINNDEEIFVDFEVMNLSNVESDSLLISIDIVDPSGEIKQSKITYSPIGSFGKITAINKLENVSKTGKYKLIIQLNPEDEQIEKNTSNNTLVYEFFVNTDALNPTLNVTFDGVRIMDGDLVSARPSINVELRDENKKQLLNDSSMVVVGIVYPGESVPRKFSSSTGQYEFYPATDVRSNAAKIVLTPEFIEDGEYQLIVNGQDAAGNSAGKTNYEISFEVITKSTLSNVLNYPNPFTDRTKFVYTLTGSSAPENFKIQIMSVSGQVVREITQLEMGPLRIGTHMTEYEWNGTDEFGDKLASGVYLYRIVAKNSEGTDYEKRETNLDSYFKHEYGKLVILR